MRAKRLHRLHRGVYAVGHPGLSLNGRWMAAVLAIAADGPGSEPLAALSHRSAAVHWGLLQPRSGPVDISIQDRGGRGRRPGIRLHRSRSLMPVAVTRRLSIPVTKPGRTISDLRQDTGPGRSASAAELRKAVRQAGVLGLPLGRDAVPDGTRSELEGLFLELCRRHALPTPEVNVRIDSFLVDFLWRDRRLIVETDGYRFHGDRAAFEEDRDRDLRLKSLGYEVVRLSYRQVAKESTRVAHALGKLLRETQARP